MSALTTVIARLRADPARFCLLALVVADLVLVWSLPVLTGQDLPQHLSYARILADYGDPQLPFRDTFTLPEHTQPYFTAYLLLAPLARVTSVLTAVRTLFTLYVIAMAWGFCSLVRAVHRRDDGALPWTCLVGALLAWNPVQCVGFFPFMLGLPAVVFGAAAVVRLSNSSPPAPLLARQGGESVKVDTCDLLHVPPALPGEAGVQGGGVSGRRVAPDASLALVVSAASAASLHFVSAACLVAFALLHALCRPTRRSAIAAITTLVSCAATVALWRLAGDPGLAAFPAELLREEVAAFGWFDGAVLTFGVQWNGPVEKARYLLATVLGPLPVHAKVLVALGALALLAVVWTSRRHAPPRDTTRSRTSYGLTVLAFAALTVVTPSAIQLPDDICLLDFRLYVLLFVFALAFVDPRWFEPLRARVAVSGFGAAVLLLWARQLSGVAGEAQAVLRLVSPLGPRDTLLALPFHDRSEYLDEANSVTHYFPVYHTALHGGVTSLFWGKFSHHLPVGYRPGRELPHPPDWGPGQFKRSDLLASTHVLVEWPDADDGDPQQRGAVRLQGELEDGFDEMACDGRWCLYRSPAAGLMEEARR